MIKNYDEGMLRDIKVIGFDADDTLWINEPYYRETENKFTKLLSSYLDEEEINKLIYHTEIKNLRLYGYGAKGFMLSLIETAIKISNKTVANEVILEILQLGWDLLNKPIELLDGVKEVLHKLSGGYKLIIATKGDLLDQERKLNNSGLAKHFHHIEIMSDKKEFTYQKLLDHLEITAGEFVMIGNSVNSDIIPALNLGASAIYVPYHTTWIHEESDIREIRNKKLIEVENIRQILKYFKY